jgi:thioredoxin-like negative regulator of GroEL
MKLTPARLILVLVLIGAGAFAYFQLRSPWVEVNERDFERRVLQAPRPALVYFDTAVGCRGGDAVFQTLTRQRHGTLDVFYVNSIDHPKLARAYGVTSDVVFVLFEGGRVVKQATAPAVLAAVSAKNNGFYSDEGFLAEMNGFLDARLP